MLAVHILTVTVLLVDQLADYAVLGPLSLLVQLPLVLDDRLHGLFGTVNWTVLLNLICRSAGAEDLLKFKT